MNQLFEGVFKCPLCTTASFLPCGFRSLQKHYFKDHFSKRVNLGAVTSFPCRCERGGKPERILPQRRARSASGSSTPLSGRPSWPTTGSAPPSAESTRQYSSTESARFFRRQRRTPDAFEEAVGYHYHCPWCEHSCSGTASEIIGHVRVAHGVRATSSDSDRCSGTREQEVTLEDPLSPAEVSGPSDEGCAKKVRFNNQVRVRLMDSDASRVEKLGSILGNDPSKEVFARGWLSAAVESVVHTSDKADTPGQSNTAMNE